MALCGTAFAQNASDFTVNANGVITKYTGFDTVVVIPATIGGRKITAIGNEAFRKADITNVTIPEGVTSIGNSAFLDNKLTAIAIPNSVTEIGESAFRNNRITSVTIPGSVKAIRRDAFRGNTALATIIISEGVETIWSGVFADTKCTSVSLPSTIISLSDNYSGDPFDLSGKPSFTLAANINAYFDSIPAFYSYIANDRKAGTYASNLPLASKKADDYEYYQTQYGAVLIRYTGNSTRVRIPATIGGVAVKALYATHSRYSFLGTFDSKKIAAVQIPESITYIGISAFALNELANVTIPNSVTYIGDNAFYQNQLTSVTIGTGVKYIGYRAFCNNNLFNIFIPNSVTYIEYDAFTKASTYRARQLTGVVIGSNVELGSTIDGFLRYDPFDSSFAKIYNDNKRAAGTYEYADGSWTKLQTVPFPAGFMGTWKRDNFNNTLTFVIDSFIIYDDGKPYYLSLLSISGDLYTFDFVGIGYHITRTIKLVNGNLVISGDSGDGEGYWNGTWKKIN